MLRRAALLLGLAATAAATLTYDNPVLNAMAPDPGVLFLNGKWWAAVTSNGDPQHFPVYSSPDLVSWKLETHLIPAGSEPVWCKEKNTDYWAPELHVMPTGALIALFVCRANNGVLSIGALHSSTGSPLGPWKDAIGKPLVGDMSDGQIDASYYYDNSTRQGYLIWKEDSNSIGKPTHIWIANLTADGTAVTSQPISLFYNTQTWEGPLTEGPWMIKEGGYYYIFYSGNGYSSPAYALGIARATTITGPYEKYQSNPIMHTDFSVSSPKFYGPGHCSVVRYPPPQASAGAAEGEAAGEWVLVYHAWNSTSTARVMLVDKLVPTDDGWFTTASGGVPSTTTEPLTSLDL